MLSCCLIGNCDAVMLPFYLVNLHLYAVYKSVCMYDQEFGCSANDAERDEVEECEEEIVRVKRMMQERKMKQDAIQSTLIRVRFIHIYIYAIPTPMHKAQHATQKKFVFVDARAGSG
jgi:hypothetical protein